MDENIQWPEGLPYLLTGWSMSPSDNILRSQPERGPAKTRRKTTAKTKNYSGSLYLSSSELDTFLQFAEDTLMDCSLSFVFPDYASNEYAAARITSYSITQSDRNGYEVALELEVLP